MVTNEELEQEAQYMLENKEMEIADLSNQYASVDLVCFHKEELSVIELRVLGALKFHSREKGYCYPTQSTICTETGYSRTKVSNAITELAKDGWIKVFPHQDNNNKIRNLYFMLNPKQVSNKKGTPACSEKAHRPYQKRHTGITTDGTETIAVEQKQLNNSNKYGIDW